MTNSNAIIFAYDRAAEAYAPVTDAVSLRAVQQCIHKEKEWATTEAYYYVVVGEREGFYPLPLVYAAKEEQEAAASKEGKSLPSETYFKWVRKNIANLITEGPMTAIRRRKWVVPMEFRRAISDAYAPLGKDGAFNFQDFDDHVSEVLKKKGTEALFEVIEAHGFALSFGQVEYAIGFGEKDLAAWSEYDPSSWEEVCLKFVGYVLASRANNGPEDIRPSDYPAVDVFIDELRARLAEITEGLEV